MASRRNRRQLSVPRGAGLCFVGLCALALAAAPAGWAAQDTAAGGGGGSSVRELVKKAPGVERQLTREGALILEDYGSLLLVERRGRIPSDDAAASVAADQRIAGSEAPAPRARRPRRPLPDGSLAPRAPSGRVQPPDHRAGARRPAPDPSSRPVRSVIALSHLQLDTSGDEARRIAGHDRAPDRLPAAARPADPGGPGLHLVQFHGPIRDAWLDTLREAGIEPIAYLPNNAYLVRAETAQIDLLTSAPFPLGPAGRSPLHWSGAYRPEYKLTRELADAAATSAGSIRVVVRLADGPRAEASLERLTRDGRRQIMAPERVGRVWLAAVELPAAELIDWAADPDVIDAVRWHEPRLAGEVGALNTAGARVCGTAPGFGQAGVGYLTWLEDHGFDTSATWSFSVNVTDTGFDNGDAGAPWHPDFDDLTRSGDRVAFVEDWTSEAGTSADGVDGDGHGTSCAGIVGGLNDAPGDGTGEVSTHGYHFGTGVAPMVQLGASKVFNTEGFWDLSPDYDYRDIEDQAHRAGARVSSNSWGADTFQYTYDSFLYDQIVRDASSEPGLQPMVVLFAAGNEGPAAGTIATPGTAKNVITLGAAENCWPGHTVCGYPSANNDTPGDDIVYYSSRGPVADGRLKPDLVAVAHGWMTTRGELAGPGCGPAPDGADTDLYNSFNGTSAATPAAAGAAALIYQHGVQSWGQAPSPAMVKAMLVATARDLEGGVDAQDVNGFGSQIGPIPNGTQGWGRIDLGRALDGTPAVRFDQQVVLGETGDGWSETIFPADPNRPVKIALAWTDVPALSYSAPWINDLDLRVEHERELYLGNHMSGGVSVAGGTPDTKNNLEVVILPSPGTGPIDVEVLAASVGGDGVPGNGDGTDQDFALYVYNATPEPRFWRIFRDRMRGVRGLPGGTGADDGGRDRLPPHNGERGSGARSRR